MCTQIVFYIFIAIIEWSLKLHFNYAGIIDLIRNYIYLANMHDQFKGKGMFYTTVSVGPLKALHTSFTPGQTYSFWHQLNFSWKHSVMLQLLHKDCHNKFLIITLNRSLGMWIYSTETDNESPGSYAYRYMDIAPISATHPAQLVPMLPWP